MTLLPNLVLDSALGHVFNSLKAAYAVTPLTLRCAEVLTATLLPAASLLILQPLEMARIRLATDKTTGDSKKYKGILDALDQIVSKEGLKGIYKTFFYSLTGLLLFKFFYKALNDKILSYLTDPDELCKCGVAAASSVLAGLLTYPLDTIRNRTAVEAGEKDALSACDTTMRIFNQEELSSFYAGAHVSLLQFPLAFAPFALRSLTQRLGLKCCGEGPCAIHTAATEAPLPPIDTIIAGDGAGAADAGEDIQNT